MPFTGSYAALFAMRPASVEAIGPEDLLVQIGTGTLTAGTQEVKTKLTSVDFAFMTYDGSVAADATWIVLCTDKIVTAEAVTVNGFATATPAFSFMFMGRVLAQL